MNILITGANRGIGLGFVQHYLKTGCHVWACFRSDQGALADMRDPNLHLVQWNTARTHPAADADLPETIDLLINNAGIYGPGKDGQSLDKVTPEAMLEVFHVDCVGPLRVVQFLKKRIVRARGVIANISSKMGSSGDNTSGGAYAYRAAKAALVIISKSMAMDLQSDGVRVISLHPGWVKTDMTNHSGLIDVETSVAGMAGVIEHVDDFDPGSFIAFDGQDVPY